MKNHLFILFVCFILFFVSCKILNSERINLTELMNSYNYVDIDSTFDMRILTYYPITVDCGKRAFASHTIGVVQNNDTIRVLSLCNRDTTFKENDIVMVVPEKKPNFHVMIPVCTEQIDKKHWNICKYQTRDFKTTYGRLVKH